MSAPTKRKRGHAKRFKIVEPSQIAWIAFNISDDYRGALTSIHAAFMAGYRAGKGAK